MKYAFNTFLFILINSFLNAQSLSVQLNKSHHECEKGSAGIQILGGVQPISISWSNGVSGVFSINELNAGDYYAHVRDASQKDTIVHFKIEQFECKVFATNHFTPNGDNYNDTWQIFRTEYHPRMKLYVYNKWGQQVHLQSGTYVPWDGKQGGVPVADGTYYYVFYFDENDTSHYLKGDVTILR